eukprot:1161671-Pelagomonas_calceolata.AAC.30
MHRYGWPFSDCSPLEALQGEFWDTGEGDLLACITPISNPDRRLVSSKPTQQGLCIAFPIAISIGDAWKVTCSDIQRFHLGQARQVGAISLAR